MKKIRICIPLTNNCEVHSKCAKSLDAISKYKSDKFTIEIKTAQTAIIALGRMSLISQSDEELQSDFDFDYYLTCDADIEFTPNNVEQLFDACESGYDIVAGITLQRDSIDCVNAGMWTDGIPGMNDIKDTLKLDEVGLKQVDWLGTAFCMVNKSVYAKLPYPWYEYKIIKFGTRRPYTGEDIGFCINLEKQGIKLFANCDCKVTHLTETIFKGDVQMKGIEMNVKTDRLSIWQLNAVCEAISNVEELTELIPFRLSNAIDKTMRLLKPVVRTVKLKRKNLLGDFDRETEPIKAELNKKMTKENEEEINRELVELVKPINTKYQTQIDDYDKYLAEEESVDIYMYRTSDLNELNKIPNVLRRGLSLMIEEVEPENSGVKND
jgi:hypothetical protein